MVKKIIKLFFVIIIISLPFLILLVINRFYPSFIRTVISDFENITHNREVAAVIAMILFYAVPVFILLKIYERFNK